MIVPCEHVGRGRGRKVVAECAPAENVGVPTSKAKSANLLKFVVDKMENLEETYNNLGKKLEDQSVANDIEEAMKINKTLASMQEQVDTYKEYKDLVEQQEEAKAMAKEAEADPELLELAKEELNSLGTDISKLEDKLLMLLLPKVSNVVL